MRLLLFLSALFAALTGSTATACGVAPQEVAGAAQAGQAVAPAHALVAAIAARPAVEATAERPGAQAFEIARAVPLYQDRLRE